MCRLRILQLIKEEGRLRFELPMMEISRHMIMMFEMIIDMIDDMLLTMMKRMMMWLTVLVVVVTVMMRMGLVLDVAR